MTLVAAKAAPPANVATTSCLSARLESRGKLERRTVTTWAAAAAGSSAGHTDSSTAAPLSTGVYWNEVVPSDWMFPKLTAMRTGTVVSCVVSPPGTFGMAKTRVPRLDTRVEPGSGSRRITATCTDVEPDPTVTGTSLGLKAGMPSYLTVTTVPPSAGPTTGVTERSCVVGSVLWSMHTPPAKQASLGGGLSESHWGSAVREDAAQNVSKEQGTKYCTGKETCATPLAEIWTCHSMGEAMLGLSKTTTERLTEHDRVGVGHFCVWSISTTLATTLPPR
mmetsp:Transcript_32135/g.81877  ORF Transcript_32135/g.81877 Transcript_32135/m.81877 type:complete len:278 (+) Transcript_32135:954-1787(+)